MGKLMIRKLREPIGFGQGAPPRAQRPRRRPWARWHEFHDKFLSYGGPPIPLLRKELVGEGGPLL